MQLIKAVYYFTKANLNINNKLTEKKPTINTSDWRGAGIAERRAGTTEPSNLFGLFLLADKLMPWVKVKLSKVNPKAIIILH
jgi:hypothetical protein